MRFAIVISSVLGRGLKPDKSTLAGNKISASFSHNLVWVKVNYCETIKCNTLKTFHEPFHYLQILTKKMQWCCTKPSLWSFVRWGHENKGNLNESYVHFLNAYLKHGYNFSLQRPYYYMDENVALMGVILSTNRAVFAVGISAKGAWLVEDWTK